MELKFLSLRTVLLLVLGLARRGIALSYSKQGLQLRVCMFILSRDWPLHGLSSRGLDLQKIFAVVSWPSLLTFVWFYMLDVSAPFVSLDAQDWLGDTA